MKNAFFPLLSAAAPLWLTLCSSVALADAQPLNDSIKLTETLADRLNCVISNDYQLGKSFQDCTSVTKGKYSFSMTISSETLKNLGFTPGQIDENSVLDIAIGDFWFNAAIAEAARRKISGDGRTVFAAWNGIHEACIKMDSSNGECLGSKNVRDTVVSVNIDGNGLALGISGDSVLAFYGSSIFAHLCDSYGEGSNTVNADFSVLLANVDITDRMEVSCSVFYRRSDKGESGTFYLRDIKIGAKWVPSDFAPSIKARRP